MQMHNAFFGLFSTLSHTNPGIPCELSALESIPLRFFCLYLLHYCSFVCVYFASYMCSGRNSNMWFSFLLSKRIILREEKQYMFLFLFGKAKHYLDLDTYKEICSTRSQSKGLSLFLFQLFSIWHTFIKRKYQEVFAAPLAGRRARAATDKNHFLAEEWCGHGHTYFVSENPWYHLFMLGLR